jgi:DNA-binding MarR family transcriptional regulator
MPENRPAHGNGNGDSGQSPLEPERLHRLLRYSHVFAAAVREVLEVKYLSEVSTHSLTLPQFHLLKLISINGHHQVGEVAEFLGVSSPAASKNIDKLERLRLVTRTTSPGDRRAILLSASPRGRRLVRQYETLKARRLTPVLNRFRSEEIDQLARLLERFSVLLFDEEKSEDGFCLRCAAYCEDHCPVGHVLGNCPYEKIRSRSRQSEGSRASGKEAS